jgi:hypothetical protein
VLLSPSKCSPGLDVVLGLALDLALDLILDLVPDLVSDLTLDLAPDLVHSKWHQFSLTNFLQLPPTTRYKSMSLIE